VVEATYPLAPIQESILFERLRRPDSGVYTEQLSCTIEGALDGDAFRRAWSAVVRRHAVLRTSLHWRKRDRPIQTVWRDVALDWKEISWDSMDSRARETRVRELLVEDRRGFDVDRPPLRFSLVKLRHDAHAFAWTFDHLLLDGWSVSIVLSEVLHCYEAFWRGEEPHLPCPPRYAEYVAWANRVPLVKAREHWRGVLAGFHASTPVPFATERRSRRVEDFVDHSHTCRIGGSALAALHGYLRAQRVTLHTVVQGAWAVLLAACSGEPDIVFGATSSGRMAEVAGIESMVGIFVNTLPARVTFRAHEQAVDWLRALQVRQAANREYEHTPLPVIRQLSGVRHDLPLFETIEALENYPTDPGLGQRGDAGLDIRDLRVWERTHYPLSLIATPGRPELELRLLYDPRRVGSSDANRILDRYQDVLTRIVAGPNSRLSDIAGGGRRRRATSTPPVHAIARGDTGALCEDAANRFDDALAVACPGASLSYSELNRRANQLARYISTASVPAEGPVAICLSRSARLVEAMLAVWKAGAAFLLIDPTHPQERLDAILADSAAPVLITDGAGLAVQASRVGRVIDLSAERTRIAAEDTCNLRARVCPTNLAYVVYTSGSTGRPRGVAVDHASLRDLVKWHLQRYRVTPDFRVAQFASVGFDAAIWEIVPALVAGASIHIAPDEVRLSAARAAAWILAEHLTIAFLPTAVAAELLDMPWPSPCSLKYLLTGGERLTRKPPAGMPFELLNHYGPAEATVLATCTVVRPGTGTPDIGRPRSSVRVHLLDHRMRPVPAGVDGEIYIGGACVARGYLHDPMLTAKRFVPDPFAQETRSGSRLFRTGDLARRNAAGRLEFVGRIDDQVKVRGVRVEPAEIESVLRRHSSVHRCAVVPRNGVDGRKFLAAYVVPDRREFFSISPPAQLAAWRVLFDQTYHPSSSGFAGWNSSYVPQQPLPAADMHEWVQHTVHRIAAQGPRRILEIGCGTGLLLRRVASCCLSYCGTDFSQSALDAAAREVTRRQLSGVTLLHRSADDFTGLPSDAFDVVVLNSVVQYFPTTEYLCTVLERALACVAPAGVLFVGDVRNLDLAETLYSSIEVFRAMPDDTARKLRARVAHRARFEQELLISPEFFRDLAASTGAAIELHVKRGRHRNELTKFRYDVMVRPDGGAIPEPAVVLDWERDAAGERALETLVREARHGLTIAGVPNARLAEDAFIVDWLRTAPEDAVASDVRAALSDLQAHGLDPDEPYRLGARSGVHVAAMCSRSDRFRFDVTFTTAERPVSGRSRAMPLRLAASRRSTTNHPLEAVAERTMSAALRETVRRALPPEFIPSAFVFVDALPMTPAGKLNRDALPDPDLLPAPGSSQPLVRRTERAVARIYSDLLGVSPVGPDDSFFELGGHSLVAMRLIERIRRQFNVDIPLADVFARPTPREVASAIEGRRDQAPVRTGLGPLLLIGKNRSHRYEPFPLTNLQRLWLAARGVRAMPAGANLYLEAEVFGDVERLARHFGEALTRVVNRHDMLRAVMLNSGSQQVLRHVPPVRIETVDGRGSDDASIEARLCHLRHLLRTASGRTDRFPLWDVAVVRLPDDRARLLVRIDALVADGYARDILAAEVSTLLDDPRRTLCEPLSLYRDYVLTVANGGSVGAAAKAREFWWERAAGIKPERWPVAREAARTCRTTSRPLLSKGAWTALERTAAETGVTPFVLLFGGFVDVLLRVAALDQVVVGLMLSDRTLGKDLAGVVGNFGTLIVHPVVNWSGASKTAFRQLQSQLAQEIEYRHFCDLDTIQTIVRNAGFTPSGVPILFNSLVDFEPAVPTPSLPTLETRIGGLVIESSTCLPGAPLVTTVFRDPAGGLSCRWEHNDTVCSQTVVDAIVSGYGSSLNDLAAGFLADREWSLPVSKEGV
jgi:amino acid adenylation domain-containing protein